MDLLLSILLIVVKSLALLVVGLIAVAYYILRRPQDLGVGAIAARPECGRRLGLAAILRGHAEIRHQGADHSRMAPTRASSCWRLW